MNSLVANNPFTPETCDLEHSSHPTSPKLFRLSSLVLGSWRTGSFQSKSINQTAAGKTSPTINSYRMGNSIRRKRTTRSSNIMNSNSITTSTSSKNSNGNKITSSSSNIKNSNIITASRSNSKISNSLTTNSIKNSNRIFTTSSPIRKDINNNTTSGSGSQNTFCTVNRKSIDRSSLDFVDEDEDLYEFDICEDERRYRPILKWTSKYGPLPILSNHKSQRIWRIFGRYRKSHAHRNPPLTTGSGIPSVVGSAGSLKTQRPGTGVSGVKGGESPLPGSPKDTRENLSSDGGYSSDEGVIADIDWDHFLLRQTIKMEKKRVHFSDPLVTLVYRHSYKSYIPKDAALVTLIL